MIKSYKMFINKEKTLLNGLSMLKMEKNICDKKIWNRIFLIRRYGILVINNTTNESSTLEQCGISAI